VEQPAPEDSSTTSEFALPQGFEAPQPAGPEQEGSAFSTPHTYSTRNAPPAFTPATGIPLVSLTKDAPWQDRMRTMLRMPVTERPAPEPVHKEDESGPAVPRVLDLTLRIGELLLAGGEGAEDVETAMLAVCRAYGLDRCEPNVTFTLLSISHQPSLVDDPQHLTLVLQANEDGMHRVVGQAGVNGGLNLGRRQRCGRRPQCREDLALQLARSAPPGSSTRHRNLLVTPICSISVIRDVRVRPGAPAVWLARVAG